ELGAMYLAAGIGTRDQYRLIRSPIDLAGFEQVRAASSADRAAAREHFGLRPDVPVALVLASLEPRKRVDLILRALASRMSAGGIQLLVGGDGPARGSLEALARRLGIADRVVFAGYIEDTPQAFIAGDLLVHAATVEGVPQVVIQAYAAGLPVAATEMVGLREVDAAPVEVAAHDGKDIDQAVARALVRPRDETPTRALEQWTSRIVQSALTRLYATLPVSSR